MAAWAARVVPWLDLRPFLLLLVLYAAIAVLAALAGLVLPDPLRQAVGALTGGAGLGGIDRIGATLGAVPAAPMWAVGAVAMTGAGALGLPVAWLYTITRRKRGYQQSLVHSLILLPVVVAGVVVLVKYSLPLAFSLAGIVAAVRFRHTLEDSKDAVFVFAATGIGLACGVELSAAAALSFGFNLATLLLFRSDFGRTPGRLEGERAQARMRRALELANRTGEFVSRVDHEILEERAPELLVALADRAWRRRAEAGRAPHEEEDAQEPQRDAVLTVETDGAVQVSLGVERVLHRLAKPWQFTRATTTEDGGQVLEYTLRLKKSTQPTAFLDAVRAAGAPGLRQARLT